jgi:tetratricopeptide (TPR) repeat protein
MFRSITIRFILIFFILINFNSLVAIAETTSGLSNNINTLEKKIEILEKENINLKNQIKNLSQDSLVGYYKQQNEDIIKTTNHTINLITMIISVVAAFIAFLTVLGTILIPNKIQKEEKAKLEEIEKKQGEIEKNLLTNLEKINIRHKEIERSFENKFERLSSEGSKLKEEITLLKREAEESADEAKRSETISKALAAFYEGNRLYDEGKYEMAVDKYTEALKYSPDDPDFYNNRGNSYYFKKDYEKAIQDYSEAIRIKDNDALYYSNRADAFYNLNENDKAIQDYRTAIRIDSNNVGNYINLGCVYENIKDYAKALENYKEALKINPNEPLAYNNLANLHMIQGDIDLAEKEIAISLQHDPLSEYSLATKAEIYLIKNQMEEFYNYIKMAFENGFPVEQIYIDEIYSKVIDEPRFKELIIKYKSNNG